MQRADSSTVSFVCVYVYVCGVVAMGVCVIII